MGEIFNEILQKDLMNRNKGVGQIYVTYAQLLIDVFDPPRKIHLRFNTPRLLHGSLIV